MHLQVGAGINVPDWAKVDSRYWRLFNNELWLKGKGYNHIEHAFSSEFGGYNKPIGIWERRPAYQLNIPQKASAFIFKKLFAKSEAPLIMHKKPKVQAALRWFSKESNLMRMMKEIAFIGQSGSVGTTVKVVQNIPVVTYWAPRHCKPIYNDANRLSGLQIHYTQPGQSFLDWGIRKDYQQSDIVAEQQYWYIRAFGPQDVLTAIPVPAGDWNPETGDDSKLSFTLVNKNARHNLKTPPAVWTQNLPGGEGYDGMSSFETALTNCISLDYLISGMGRGLHHAQVPKVMIKGRPMNNGQGPSSVISLPPDRKAGDNSVTGATAQILQSDATSIIGGMDSFVMHLYNWTQDLIGTNKKDPAQIKGGVMSGIAMKLLNEDLFLMVNENQSIYIDGAMMDILKIGARLCIQAKVPQFEGVSEGDLDDIELKCPALYTVDMDEAKALVEVIGEAKTQGLINNQTGKVWFAAMTDVDSAVAGASGDDHNAEDDDQGESAGNSPDNAQAARKTSGLRPKSVDVSPSRPKAKKKAKSAK